MPGSSRPLSSSPRSALRERGARPRAALLFWLRGGNAARRPEGGELSPSVWISLLAIATSSLRTKMRPAWTMAGPPASRPRLPPPDRSQDLPRSSVARRPGTPPPPAAAFPSGSPGRSGRGARTPPPVLPTRAYAPRRPRPGHTASRRSTRDPTAEFPATLCGWLEGPEGHKLQLFSVFCFFKRLV